MEVKAEPSGMENEFIQVSNRLGVQAERRSRAMTL